MSKYVWFVTITYGIVTGSKSPKARSWQTTSRTKLESKWKILCSTRSNHPLDGFKCVFSSFTSLLSLVVFIFVELFIYRIHLWINWVSKLGWTPWSVWYVLQLCHVFIFDLWVFIFVMPLSCLCSSSIFSYTIPQNHSKSRKALYLPVILKGHYWLGFTRNCFFLDSHLVKSSQCNV